MVNLQRLTTIKELTPGAWSDGGDETNKYVKTLMDFIDSFPIKEEALRGALAAGDGAALADCATDVRDMLFQIGADKLAVGSMEKIAELPSMSAGSTEAFVENFLGSASALSIDIQMAIYGVERSPEEIIAAAKDHETTILAVDDNAFFLNTLKSYLQDSPYKLTCVSAGSVALRFLEKHTPDLFILDIDMPEMDGYELATKIREKGFKAPIIFLTGNASKDYVIKAVKVGASDFIIKPISKDQALEKIAKYV